MRRVILCGFLFAVTAIGLAPGAAAAEHQSSCPNGYTAHAVPQTEAEMRQLPRIDAGLDATPAPYTVQELIDLGNSLDENDDGTFCLKAVSNLSGASVNQWGFFYSARDNNTAAS
jgi:hypothetical protein